MPATIRATNIAPKGLTDAVAEWIDSSCDQYLLLDNQDYSIKVYQIEDSEQFVEHIEALDQFFIHQAEAKSENTERKVIIKTDHDTTKLERHVIAWLNEQAEDYNGDLECVYKDLQQTGYPSHLTYYNDSTAFFDEYETEIEVIINNLRSEGVLHDDPIIKDGFSMSILKQRLAWIAFEETARKILLECGLEI